MRVILSVDAVHPPLTGIGRYALELARGFRANPRLSGVRYFSMGHWVDPARFDSGSALDAAEPGETGLPGSPPSLLARLRPVLAASRLAVEGYRRLAPAWYRWRLRGCADALFHAPNYFLPPVAGPAVATLHDLSTLRFPAFHPAARVALLHAELPRTLARATWLIAPSEAVRREIVETLGWPANRIAAIGMGVAPEFHPRPPNELAPRLRPHGLEPDGYCLCVATIEPRKNLSRLLDAHLSLPASLRRRYPLVLAGAAGWNSADLHARIDREQRRGGVRYLDYVPAADLPALFAGARLFAFPSLYEGFGIPPLEAMASGVPVVVSTCPALRELAGSQGLLVDPEDTQGLAAALRRGLEDDPWRLVAREAGLRRAQDYPWTRCVERTLDCYARVLGLTC